MAVELKALAIQLDRPPTLSEYVRETRYELADLYKPSVGGWLALLGEAGFEPEKLQDSDLPLLKRFQLLLHIDSVTRLRFYLQAILDDRATMAARPQSQRRMLEMLTFRLLQAEARDEATEWSRGLTRIQRSSYLREEFESLVTALLDQIRVHAEEHPIFKDSPVFLHRQYTRDEILVGLGLKKLVGKFQAQTGRVWIKELNTELLFVTLDKSEKTFSPTTRYEDFALSPTQFHWQSQSTTGENSPTGQRYVRQQENGVTFLLFVRPAKDDAFVFLGPVKYLSHSGSRPMSIYWQLEHPIPAWFLEVCASLRAA